LRLHLINVRLLCIRLNKIVLSCLSKILPVIFQYTLCYSQTYSVDKQVSDSGATATAFLCGVKSKFYTVGVNGKVNVEDCASSKGNEVDSVLVDAYRAGTV